MEEEHCHTGKDDRHCQEGKNWWVHANRSTVSQQGCWEDEARRGESSRVRQGTLRRFGDGLDVGNKSRIPQVLDGMFGVGQVCVLEAVGKGGGEEEESEEVDKTWSGKVPVAQPGTA
jgi:hypothetical protein